MLIIDQMKIDKKRTENHLEEIHVALTATTEEMNRLRNERLERKNIVFASTFVRASSFGQRPLTSFSFFSFLILFFLF